MSSPEPSAPHRFELSGGRRGGHIAFTAEGIEVALKPRRGPFSIPYGELTHVDTSERGLWLATRKTTMLVRRSLFAQPEGPETFVRALGEKLEGFTAGPQLIDRMLEIGERARSAPPRRVTTVFAVLCIVVFLMQIRWPLVMEIGSFVPALVQEGELWRIVTGNFLHGFSLLPVHLFVNMMCLFAFGLLVERPLGGFRTFIIMAVGGIGAMLGSAVAGYQEVVGASGVVAALAGAVLWLEFNAAERLPGWWRLPRRMFIAVLLLQACVDALLPFVAGGAHLGGFVGGYLVARWVVPGAFEGRAPTLRLRRAAGVLALLTLVSFTSAGQLLFREGVALELHAQRLLTLADSEPLRLNNLAFRIVTEFEPTEKLVALAVKLAQKAVEETQYADPDYLDTLAEVLFVAGNREGAVEVIDRAIAIAGGERYFYEQRRRFTGARAADDRPPPPTLPWSLRKRLGEPQLGPLRPGLSI